MIHIISGGTMVHVAPHFSLCAPSYGTVGRKLHDALGNSTLHLTRMAGGSKELETVEDVNRLVDELIHASGTRCIVLAAAICDFKPETFYSPGSNKSDNMRTRFGKDQPRLKSRPPGMRYGDYFDLDLVATDKIAHKIRKNRKDIFSVLFKTTTNVSREETYAAGLSLLKEHSANLVFANDIQRQHNMIITPEEYPYYYHRRIEAIQGLADFIKMRTKLTFKRTEIWDGERVEIQHLVDNGHAPANFLEVLSGLIKRGAFKPFKGKTTGHFGCKVTGRKYQRISSCRKENHNDVLKKGFAKIYGEIDNKIVAEGGKPSVGEHTQTRIYEKLGDKIHSIVHFHCPRKTNPKHLVGLANQKPYECGSVECAENTATNMKKVIDGVFVVDLEGHGPNIAFHKDIPPGVVLDFIEANWDLAHKTGGLIGDGAPKVHDKRSTSGDERSAPIAE